MTRRPLSTKARLTLFQEHGGICHICGGKIIIGQSWEVEHVIPLAQGGADAWENMAPAHVKCHRAKTAKDATDTARAKRREASHIGARAPSRTPLPFGRKSKLKRKISGEVVER
jgi:5-methylcytosine-specific restriction endonuclease McrA